MSYYSHFVSPYIGFASRFHWDVFIIYYLFDPIPQAINYDLLHVLHTIVPHEGKACTLNTNMNINFSGFILGMNIIFMTLFLR